MHYKSIFTGNILGGRFLKGEKACRSAAKPAALRKYLTGLTLVTVVTGGVFAQENTVTVDIGPMIMGFFLGGLGDMLGESSGAETGGGTVKSSGFGIGVQYERRVLEQVSVGGRFAYLGCGFGISAKNDDGDVVSVEQKLSSFSIEGHGRYYPFVGTFFLDGMLGYANMSTVLEGELTRSKGIYNPEEDYVRLDASRHFFKLGAKLGWRIVFGTEGGFVFEPALGYYGGLGGGKSVGKQLIESAKVEADIDDELIGNLDDAFKVLESVIFIGGPRLSLSFGWNF